jgi:hypothetical protein
MSSNERHNRRDEIISLKHRTWGHNVPAVDIDFLLCEYDRSIAQALIEYRHVNGTIRVDANMNALINLADRADLPFFVVRYRYATDDGTKWKEATVDTEAFFWITAMNEHAKQELYSWGDDDWMNEEQYKTWLHKIRGR